MKKIWIFIPFVVLSLILPAQAALAPHKGQIPLNLVSNSDVILKRVVQCESGNNPQAKGKAGEIGILQFMPSTWKEWTSRMKRPDLDIYNSEDQIIVYNWAAKNGLLNHWTCFRKIFN